MWSFEHLIFFTVLAALAVVAIAAGGLYLSIRALRHYRVAVQAVTVTATIAVAIVFFGWPWPALGCQPRQR
jgi:hypothetical protein